MQQRVGGTASAPIRTRKPGVNTAKLCLQRNQHCGLFVSRGARDEGAITCGLRIEYVRKPLPAPAVFRHMVALALA